MKTLKLLSVFCALFMVANVFISCEEETNNNSSCKVVKTKLTNGGADTSTYGFTYNTDGKLIKSDMGVGYYFTYTWETNKVTLKYYCDDTVNYTEVYVLNFEGNAISSNHSSKGVVTSNTTYEYTDDGYLYKKTVDPVAIGVATDLYTYEYSDGNLVTMYHDQSEEGNYASNTAYEYYSDKKDTYNTSLSIFGKDNTNLVKKTILTATSPFNSTLTTNYSYQTDSEGKVLKIMQTIGVSTIYTIPVYECDL